MLSSIFTYNNFFTEKDQQSFFGNEDFKSTVVTIGDIEAVKPPSLHWTDEETLSQWSGSSLTTVSSLNNLSILSLSEGEIVLPVTRV